MEQAPQASASRRTLYGGKMNIEEQVELLMQGTEYGDEELKKAMANELRQRLVDAQK